MGAVGTDRLPSAKRLHSYGKPPFLMHKPTINGNVRWLCQIIRGYTCYLIGMGMILGIRIDYLTHGLTLGRTAKIVA